MTKLTNVVHFRGETITLFATFKDVSAAAATSPTGILNPQVKVEYANALGVIVQVLPPTFMNRISTERYFYNYEIPEDAAMTTYNVVYTAVIADKEVFATEEFTVGNPNITYNRATLRYGPHSYLQKPREKPVRKPLGLPLGEF